MIDDLLDELHNDETEDNKISFELFTLSNSSIEIGSN